MDDALKNVEEWLDDNNWEMKDNMTKAKLTDVFTKLYGYRPRSSRSRLNKFIAITNFVLTQRRESSLEKDWSSK